MAWLLGQQPEIRSAVQDVLSAILTYVVATVLLIAGALHDVFPVWVAAGLIGYFFICWGTFYTLTRTGWSQKLADPHLTYARVLVDISSMISAYALIPMTRGASLQILCAMLAFYMGRLNQQQILTTSFIAVAWMMLTLAGLWLWQPTQIDISVEILNLVMCSVLLPLAGFIGGQVYRIHQSVTKHRDQLQGTLKTLENLSNQDVLTGLANRRHAQHLLEEERRRQDRHGHPFTVAMLDIDHFKAINDTHGHATGDDVLKAFAQLALHAIAPTDTLARWGGEEFLLIMPHTDAAQAAMTLEGLHEAIRRHDWQPLTKPMTFSAGLAQHGDTEPLEDTIKRCDEALYRAKGQGRNRTEQAHLVAPNDATHRTKLKTPVVPSSLPSTASAPLKTTHGPQTSSAHRPRKENTPSWLQWWIDLICGDSPWMRRRLKLMLVGFSGLMCWAAVLHLHAIPHGLITAQAGYSLAVYQLLFAGVCYAMARTGITHHWRDPHMSLLQLGNACVVGVMFYLVSPPLRAVLLQSICVVLIFGMVVLRPTENKILGGMVIALMLSALLFELTAPLNAPLTATEILKTVLACFIFLQIAVFAYNASSLREEVMQEQTHLNEAVRHVHGLVSHDALTGLYNRGYLLDLLEHERLRFERSKLPFCLAMIDLDHFKHINDRYGHDVGDKVLIEFGRLACEIMRETDVVGRWGGEEFLIVMPDMEAGAAGFAGLERLREKLAEHRLPGYPEMRLSMSCGLADFRVNESLAQTLARADQALYQAKAQGRNRCVLAA